MRSIIRFERAYTRLIGRMVAHSGFMCIIALVVIGGAGYGLSRVPTGFLPIEDQGYILVTRAAAGRRFAERTQAVMDQVSESPARTRRSKT